MSAAPALHVPGPLTCHAVDMEEAVGGAEWRAGLRALDEALAVMRAHVAWAERLADGYARLVERQAVFVDATRPRPALLLDDERAA